LLGHARPPTLERPRVCVPLPHGCSGDNTLPATLLAVREVVCPAGRAADAAAALGGGLGAAEVPADDRLVFVMSDANLGRYGTDPKELARALTGDPRVHGYCLFLAEPSAADWLAKEMPLGRGVVCMDTAALPGCLKDMFARAAATAAQADP
jgi:hypothetical protein